MEMHETYFISDYGSYSKLGCTKYEKMLNGCGSYVDMVKVMRIW